MIEQTGGASAGEWNNEAGRLVGQRRRWPNYGRVLLAVSDNKLS